MSRPVTIRRLATQDLQDAKRWYDARRAGLGDEFLDAFVESRQAIAERPESFPVVHADVRRAILDRFPYLVFFRVRRNDVLIVAVMHGNRNPASWKSRG